MKRMLTLGLALVLILGMATTATAGSDKSKEIKTRMESQLQVHSEDAVEAEEKDEEEGLSQGAVQCLLTIDGGGTVTLVAKRGSVEKTFTGQIPSGLDNAEAILAIKEVFVAQILEALGLEVNSFKALDFRFDQATSTTTATLLAIHGEAPIKLPKGLEVSAASKSHGSGKSKGR